MVSEPFPATAPGTTSTDRLSELEKRMDAQTALMENNRARLEQNSTDICDLKISMSRIHASLKELVARVASLTAHGQGDHNGGSSNLPHRHPPHIQFGSYGAPSGIAPTGLLSKTEERVAEPKAKAATLISSSPAVEAAPVASTSLPSTSNPAPAIAQQFPPPAKVVFAAPVRSVVTPHITKPAELSPYFNVTQHPGPQSESAGKSDVCEILVESGKGGVGESSFSAQPAFILVVKDSQVGLLDIDICDPNIPKMLGLERQEIHQSNLGWSPVCVESNLGVMSIGFMLPHSCEAVIWRGPRKHGLIKQFLKDVSWGELDFLVVEAPPGTYDEHISIVQYLEGTRIDGSIVVTTPQQVPLIDVRKEVSFCKKIGVKVLGVVENMNNLRQPITDFKFMTMIGIGEQADVTRWALDYMREQAPEMLLHGLLSPAVFSQELQEKRVMHNLCQYDVPLHRYKALMDLQERTKRLFYKLLIDNAAEVLKHWGGRSIQLIVVIEGERIQGLGALGCQGMGAPVGVFSLCSALGGVRPSACLPINIDVGTNCEMLLSGEFYIGLGWIVTIGLWAATVLQRAGLFTPINWVFH